MSALSLVRLRRRETGATLIVALIMLVAMAMLAVWAFNTGTTNLRIVGNSQSRQHALSAAQGAIEKTMSSNLFVSSPQVVAASPVPVDVDGDGRTDYSAQLTPAPSCYRLHIVRSDELDPGVAQDIACYSSGAAHNAGVILNGANNAVGDSMCADSEWNLRAQADDPSTGARAIVNQGVAVRSLTTDATNGCP